MCKCMMISKNTYYNWLNTKDLDKTKPAKINLKKRIKSIIEERREICGSCRIQ